MPNYVYEVITTGETFEQLQSLADPRLTVHPVSGEPVRRLITAPNLTLNHSDAANRTKLSGQNLSRHGFTKYEKAAKGHYVKTSGDNAPPNQLGNY
jgi:hypothetical protein